MATADYNGVQKAAILLITLGPERSADIFKHLKEEEIEELTLEIANTRSVSPQVKEDILNEFYQVCLAQQYIAEGGIGYAKELLDKALGQEKAQEVISKLTASLQVRPFEFVRKTDPSQLLNFIQDEHPQTIAMILSYLTAAQAAMVLGALPPEKQADVAKRIAMMDRTSPDVIKEAVEAGSVKVISNASLATEPVSPNIKKNTMLAAAVGFVLVIGIIVLQVLLDNKINTEEDVTKYLDMTVLGVIPQYDQGGKKE